MPSVRWSRCFCSDRGRSDALRVRRDEDECEAAPTDKKKIMVLGGGPNRIGQGIEFDYCCVHAAMAMREDGSYQQLYDKWFSTK